LPAHSTQSRKHGGLISARDEPPLAIDLQLADASHGQRGVAFPKPLPVVLRDPGVSLFSGAVIFGDVFQCRRLASAFYALTRSFNRVARHKPIAAAPDIEDANSTGEVTLLCPRQSWGWRG